MKSYLKNRFANISEKRFYILIKEIDEICKSKGYRFKASYPKANGNNKYFNLIFDSLFMLKYTMMNGHHPSLLKKHKAYAEKSIESRFRPYLIDDLDESDPRSRTIRVSFDDAFKKYS